MTLFNTLVITVLLLSVLMGLFMLNRLLGYRRSYPLPEDRYTKLFGFITKELVMIAYLLAILFQIIFTIWFLFLL